MFVSVESFILYQSVGFDSITNSVGSWVSLRWKKACLGVTASWNVGASSPGS